MAGHSHGANIFYRKSAVDRKRGQLFSKLAKMIMSAARQAGGDPDSNLKLRYAIDKARAVSMPKDNIERAIKKGTGELEGVTYEEVAYEGYAAGGVAVMVEALTDNRHRTAPELRKLFESSGGNLGATGSVSWMFERKSVFTVRKEGGPSEETLLEAVLEAGADDLVDGGEVFEIRGPAASFQGQQKTLVEAKKVPVATAEVSWVPKSSVDVQDPDVARQVVRLIDALEEHEDVQNVFANYEIPGPLLAAIRVEAGAR
jgi:YebC/PmpR family DNA-binding regulatory protein